MDILAIRQQAQHYFDNGLVEEAESCLQNHRDLVEKDIETCFLLGMIFLKQDKFTQAEVSFKRVLALNPNVHEAHTNLGILFRTKGALHQAKVHLEKALQIDPTYIPAWQTLGVVLCKLSALDHGIECFKKIIELKPDYAVAYKNIGDAYRGKGDIAQSEFWYRRALSKKKDFLPAQLGLLEVYSARKEKNKLHDLKESLISRYPNNTNVAIALGHAAKLLGDDERILKMLKRCLSQENHFEQRHHLYFRMARILDRNKDYSQAFSYFQKANQMRSGNYDSLEMEESVKKIIELYGKASLDDGFKDNNDEKEFVFIVGMPRSGTSLIEQILDSHPEVKGMGELTYIGNLVSSLNSLAELNNYSLNEKKCQDLASKYREKVLADVGDVSPSYLVDKMPSNFLHVGFIRKIFPHAPIIHCRRHPLDTGLSNFIQDFGGDMAYTYDLSDIGHYYGQYHKLMAHWDSVFGESLLTIHYENLVQDFETEVRKVLNYCRLPWNDHCLDFHKNKRVIATASVSQVSEPLYKSSVGRWRCYANELEPLKTALNASGIEFNSDR